MENQPILNSDLEPLIFEDWGLIDYELAVQKQLQYVEKVATENSRGYLVFCTHPPIVTKGRSTQPDDIYSWSGPVHESSRGGRATYHGPSQIVVYPIVNLKFQTQIRKSRDVVAHLRTLEECLVKTLRSYSIEAVGRSRQVNPNSETEGDETGVWVGSHKIASLGIAARKWVTYHGAAINFENDAEAFQGIKPCGFQPQTMISVEQILNQKISRSEFSQALASEMLKLL
ncbi:MAG: lipoyl(octanoyl) transferase LipB [Bdellovibrionales bacterium]